MNQGNRLDGISRFRSETAERLVKELRMSLAEVARLLKFLTSAISKILRKTVLRNKRA